jgi:esterase/lipase
LFPWLESKPYHIEKYTSIYIQNGFDVLVARTEHILRPIRTQETALNVVKFLENNESYRKVAIQGFSVGGYFWGETLIQLYKSEKAASIQKRIKCQVWDSAVSSRDAPIGISTSIFPNNKFMEALLRKLIEIYFKIAFESVTKHLYKSDDFFQGQPVKAPALLIGSKVDKIATEKVSKTLLKNFLASNVDTTLKLFEDSQHVQHYQKHKEEYLTLLMNHLRKCELIENKEKR